MTATLMALCLLGLIAIGFLGGFAASDRIGKACIKEMTDARVAAYIMKQQRDSARAAASKYKQAYIAERKKNQIMNTAKGE